jgi:protein-arginine kinase activator protein McsA
MICPNCDKEAIFEERYGPDDGITYLCLLCRVLCDPIELAAANAEKIASRETALFGSSDMSDKACLEFARSYKCDADEDSLTCEQCGCDTREQYVVRGWLVCRDCFLVGDGPAVTRAEASRDMAGADAGE